MCCGRAAYITWYKLYLKSMLKLIELGLNNNKDIVFNWQ